jgi:starch phosphorylase
MESPVTWSPERHLKRLPERVTLAVEGRSVQIGAWQYLFAGVTGHTVPLIFLDADLPENLPGDRSLTDYLYGGDERYRLCQEAILGIGGVLMLRALGYHDVRVFHMNEGHSALATLALLEEQSGEARERRYSENEIESVRRQCVFTTHTPVPAGHDRFPADLSTVLVAARCVEHFQIINGSI